MCAVVHTNGRIYASLLELSRLFRVFPALDLSASSVVTQGAPPSRSNRGEKRERDGGAKY